MRLWLDLLNMAFAGLALGAILWALRQQAILRRVSRGLRRLKVGAWETRVRRSPQDNEDVLVAFDEFAEHCRQRASEQSTVSVERDQGRVLEQLCGALRPPLLTIQTHALMLEQNQEQLSVSGRQAIEHLRGQVTGLLRLLEASPNLSELGRGLSLASEPPEILESIPTPVVLLVDEESEWAARLRDLLSSRGARLLVAPGIDAAVTMASLLNPRLLLFNAARNDGLGWRALGRTRRLGSARAAQIALFARDQGEVPGRIWSPSDIWLWPLDQPISVLLANYRDGDSRRIFTLHGDPELSEAIAAAWTQEGVEVDRQSPEPAITLDLAVTLLVLEPGEPDAREIAQVLIVDEASLEQSASALATEFMETRWIERVGGEELLERLAQRLATRWDHLRVAVESAS